MLISQCLGKLMILTETYNGTPTIPFPEDIQMGGPFYVGFDESAFDWLKPALLKDTVFYLKKKCFHYQGDVTVHAIQPTNIYARKRPDVVLFCEAWIDQDTLRPVALYDGSNLGVFTFVDPPPTGPLTPPKVVQAELDHMAASKPIR